MSSLQPTQDPHVYIEAQHAGYIRYRRTSDGRRWEVHGTCVGLGYCIVGAVIDGQVVPDLATARRIARTRYWPLDDPVTPEFRGCCPFTYTELPPVGAS